MGRLLEELKLPLEAVVLLNLDLRSALQASHRPADLRGLRPGLQHLHRARGRCSQCDKCGDKARLIQRPDDREEVIGKRLEVFEAQTKPLIKHYQQAGLLRVVDADADVDTVFKSIQRAVEGGAPPN